MQRLLEFIPSSAFQPLLSNKMMSTTMVYSPASNPPVVTLEANKAKLELPELKCVFIAHMAIRLMIMLTNFRL